VNDCLICFSFAHKINTAETNGESPERISRPVETLKPKESKVMASKKRNARKKESKGAVVTMPNKIENGLFYFWTRCSVC